MVESSVRAQVTPAEGGDFEFRLSQCNGLQNRYLLLSSLVFNSRSTRMDWLVQYRDDATEWGIGSLSPS